MNSAINTIQIGRREFSVTTQTAGNGELQYVLTGKRGAIYGTMRNVNRKHMMFLIDGRGFGMAKGYEGIWLTDESGELKVAGR